MHSPLPDSGALEAGIIEDSRPSRLSRVQDNVRNLLRSSVFGSVHDSPLPPPRHPQSGRTPLQSPIAREHQPQYIHSPTESTASETTSSTTSNASDHEHVPGVLFPPRSYHQAVHDMAQSTMFNTRAVAALSHPDLNDPSLAVFLQHKAEDRQQRSWTRSRRCRRRRRHTRSTGPQILLCVLLSLGLASLLATYTVIATTSQDVTPTFHILFILGIILVTITFSWSLLRLCMIPHARKQRKACVGPVVASTNRRHPENECSIPQMPNLAGDGDHFVPATPIQVHSPVDEVRPDSREAQPSIAVFQTPDVWDKDVARLPNPPPAYGRWRGSVRADPELLHFVPSPTDSEHPDLPSPIYEESQRQGHTESPPSYVTRESPSRRRQGIGGTTAQAQVTPEPEMVEINYGGVPHAP